MSGLPRTMPELVKKAIAGALQDVHVALPGQVVSWDPILNLADVQVMIQHPVYDDDNDRVYEDIGTLVEVPVVWPRAGGCVITMPLASGDSGLLVFCSSPIGEWRMSGQSSQPADASRQSIGWPVFLPGLFPDIKPLSPNPLDIAARAAKMCLGVDGSPVQIRISPSGIELGGVPTDFVALATGVAGALNAMKAAYDSHTHTAASILDHLGGACTGATSGPAPSFPAVPAVAATSVRAQ